MSLTALWAYASSGDDGGTARMRVRRTSRDEAREAERGDGGADGGGEEEAHAAEQREPLE